MRQVFVGQHSAEAHFVKGLLEADGIETEVRGEALFGVRGEVPATPDTLPSVWVQDSEVERARALVAAYERREDPPAVSWSEWRCPKCDESLDAQFTDCWQCGTSRPKGR